MNLTVGRQGCNAPENHSLEAVSISNDQEMSNPLEVANHCCLLENSESWRRGDLNQLSSTVIEQTERDLETAAMRSMYLKGHIYQSKLPRVHSLVSWTLV
jgi:hypothetical protein